MAMDIDVLADEIQATLIIMLNADPNINFYPTPETKLAWKAVITAIVEHIRDNAQLTLNNNVMPHTGWKIT